jgi:hypothetical protein
MATADSTRILTINAGFLEPEGGTYDMSRAERQTLAVQVDRIGQSDTRMRITDGDAVTLLDRTIELDTHESGGACVSPMACAGNRLRSRRTPSGIASCTEGRALHAPHFLTAAVLRDLQELVPLDPVLLQRVPPLCTRFRLALLLLLFSLSNVSSYRIFLYDLLVCYPLKFL